MLYWAIWVIACAAWVAGHVWPPAVSICFAAILALLAMARGGISL